MPTHKTLRSRRTVRPRASASSPASAVCLRTPRLLLRPFRADDWAAVRAYDNDPEVLKYLGMAPRTDEGTRAFLTWAERVSREEPRRYWPFAVVLQGSGELIGGCCLRIAADILGALDCGIELNRRYWNNGYGTEALRELVRYAFEVLHARHVLAECHRDNVRSQRVLEKARMQQVPFPEGRKAELVQRGLWNDDQFWSVAAAARAAAAPGEG